MSSHWTHPRTSRWTRMREAPCCGRYTPADESPSRARCGPVLVRHHGGSRRRDRVGAARRRLQRRSLARRLLRGRADRQAARQPAHRGDRRALGAVGLAGGSGRRRRACRRRAVAARRDRRCPRRRHPAAHPPDLPQRAQRVLGLRAADGHRPPPVDRRRRGRVSGAARVPGRRRRELAGRARRRRAPRGAGARRDRQGRHRRPARRPARHLAPVPRRTRRCPRGTR